MDSAHVTLCSFYLFKDSMLVYIDLKDGGLPTFDVIDHLPVIYHY